MGDSHTRLREFPKEARQNLGKALRDVQLGKDPPDSKPVPGVGRHGVFELRDEDESAWYRVIYLKKIRNIIYVLHSFEKESNRIEKQDIRTIKQRLSQVDSIEREEARDAKRRERIGRSRHGG
jgi:phage-related protein